MEVLLPQSLDQAALDSVLRLHVEVALSKNGQRLIGFAHGPGLAHSPGVTCWPVTYTSSADENAAS